MSVLVGVDVGGTFTDVVALDGESGRIAVAKVPSTPENQATGFLNALAKVGVALPAAGRVMHGTTVATNAVLEGKGARVGMLVTAGFRDVLEIGRGERTRLYDFKLLKHPPLVPRPGRFEVRERTRADGTIAVPVTAEAVREALAGQPVDRFEAWVVGFLHAWANRDNEERAAAILRELVGDIPIACSAAVVAEYREYERLSTAVLNAYVAPLMARYLGDLEARLATAGYRRPLFVMQSNGGTMTARLARRLPAATMLSGPAGGVAGALAVAAQAGLASVITCDMGGTSTDVCLVKAGRVRQTTEARIAGYPTRIPQLDIVTVGAGGGSIARVEEGGVLRVGPESAGASPGPACYGLGGERATVTDAHVVLNRLDPGAPLSGEITLYPDRARKAIAEVAARLGDLDILAMADGIVRLAVVRMASAIREVSVYRGENPRDFVLLAFGGAGPMVAAELARELGMASVLVPPHPGNLSALGLLVSPLRRDLVQTRIARLSEIGAPSLDAGLRELEVRAVREFEGEGLAAGALQIQRAVDLRYVGQSFTLTVPLPPGTGEPRDLAAAFHTAHEATFGHAAPGEPVELVNLRVSASLPGAPIRLQAGTEAATGPAAPARTRPVYFRGRLEPSPVYERRALGPGVELAGPLLVEEPGSSTVLWPGDRLRVDAEGNLRIEVADR